ncbi:hypothetical protein [Microbacterium testaceum]|uniref:hypothetical protein n=1 Tax=Microbacterium testaceum TaxID=2033 RepID=UPI00128F1A18|nr:hypothetical protein [Microbacterium testaceum]
MALSTSAAFPQSTQDLLLSGTLSPDQVAAAWAVLAQSPAASTDAFVRQWASVLPAVPVRP